MSDWLLNLPVLWMAVVVFAATYLLTASIDWVVTRLAVDDRARAFKALSPGLLWSGLRQEPPKPRSIKRPGRHYKASKKEGK